MKSSPSIWHYVVNVKSTVKISSIFVAFLENMNFNIFFDQESSLVSILTIYGFQIVPCSRSFLYPSKNVKTRNLPSLDVNHFLHFGTVHKLCRLKIGDFWPPTPLSSFLLSRVYLLNRLWGFPTPLPRWYSLWTAPFLICIEKAMHFFRSRWCAIDQNKWFTRTIKIIEKFSSWIQMKA